MSDGREERFEREKQYEQEKQKDQQDRINRRNWEDPYRPERRES